MSIVAPPGAEGGQRLLLSVPLPPQVMHVTLPPLATPGKLVEFQLRAPLVDVPDGPLDALALAAGESRGILLERSSSGGLKRKAPTMGNGGMFIGGAADGSAITSPSRKRAPRGLSSAEAAIFGAHDERSRRSPFYVANPAAAHLPDLSPRGSHTPRSGYRCAVSTWMQHLDATRLTHPSCRGCGRCPSFSTRGWRAGRCAHASPLPAFSLAELEQTLCLGPDIAATPAAAALAATAEDAAAPTRPISTPPRLPPPRPTPQHPTIRAHPLRGY